MRGENEGREGGKRMREENEGRERGERVREGMGCSGGGGQRGAGRGM